MIGLLPPIRAITRLGDKSYLAGVGFSKIEAKNNLIKAVQKYIKDLGFEVGFMVFKEDLQPGTFGDKRNKKIKIKK